MEEDPFRRTAYMSHSKKSMINTCVVAKTDASLPVTALDNIRSAKCVGLLVKNTNKGEQAGLSLGDMVDAHSLP